MIHFQRKPEDEPEDDEASKKAKTDEEKKPEPAEDEKAGGDGPATNGATNGVDGTNGTTSPEKKEEVR